VYTWSVPIPSLDNSIKELCQTPYVIAYHRTSLTNQLTNELCAVIGRHAVLPAVERGAFDPPPNAAFLQLSGLDDLPPSSSNIRTPQGVRGSPIFRTGGVEWWWFCALVSKCLRPFVCSKASSSLGYFHSHVIEPPCGSVHR